MRIHTLKTILRGCSCSIVAVCLGLLCLFPAMVTAVSQSETVVPTIKRNPQQVQAPEEQYSAAKNHLNLLTSEQNPKSNRSQWLSLANTFQHLHLQQRSHELGPACLFMTAQVYRMAHLRFHVDDDALTARQKYLELADLYPGHALADDALFEAAALTLYAKDKTPAANTLYQQIVTQYPKGDQAAKASQLLHPDQSSKKENPASNVTTTTSQPQPESSPKNLVNITPPKFWSSDQYGRIVIGADSSVFFRTIKEDTQTNQLILELQGSTIDSAHCIPRQLDKGLLQQISTTQPKPGIVRFHIDASSFTEYKVFTLNKPFRIVLDMYGSASDSRVSPELTTTASPDAGEKKETTSTSKEETTPIGAVPLLQETKKIRASAQLPRIKSRRETLSLAQQLGLGVKTIVIDPGHGGKDPGAMAFGLKEKDIVLKVAKKLGKILTENFHYQVILTRTKDVFIPLERRTALANSHKADLFISIHINAHGNQTHSGIETYFLNLATDADAMRVAALENASSTHSIGELQQILSSLMNNSKIDESSRLARFVQTNLINGFANSYQPKDLGVKQAPFYVLIGAEMPAILAELSFITNPEEANLLKNEQHLEKIAQKLAGGIVAYVDHHRAAFQMQ